VRPCCASGCVGAWFPCWGPGDIHGDFLGLEVEVGELGADVGSGLGVGGLAGLGFDVVCQVGEELQQSGLVGEVDFCGEVVELFLHVVGHALHELDVPLPLIGLPEVGRVVAVVGEPVGIGGLLDGFVVTQGRGGLDDPAVVTLSDRLDVDVGALCGALVRDGAVEGVGEVLHGVGGGEVPVDLLSELAVGLCCLLCGEPLQVGDLGMQDP